MQALDLKHTPHRDGGGWTVLVKCLGCGAGQMQIAAASGVAPSRVLTWPPPPELGPWVGRRGCRAGGPDEPPPSQAKVDGWRSALLANRDALRYLEEKRGLTLATISAFELGCENGSAITIPVRDEWDELETLKRRFLDPAADPKTRNLSRQASLYPISSVTVGPRAVVVCEGELDACLLNQYGIPAITGTAGTHWNPEWNRWVEARQVAVVYDAGSFDLAAIRANDFRANGAKDAWPVDLTRADFAKGEDATDWFVKYGRSAGELANFINESRRWCRRGRAS
jgi:hypothetical protein